MHKWPVKQKTNSIFFFKFNATWLLTRYLHYLQLLTGIYRYFNLFTNSIKGGKEEKRCKHQVRRGKKEVEVFTWLNLYT